MNVPQNDFLAAGRVATRARHFILLLLAILTVSALPISASAGLLVYEPFADATAYGGTAYTTGADVTGANTPATASGQNNGTLVGGGGGATWYAAGATGGVNVASTVSATNLSVAGLADSSGGSMLYGAAAGPSARVNVGSTITSGSVYYSFALKVTDLGSLNTSGGFVVGLNNAGGAQTNTPSVVSSVLMIRAVGSAASGNFNLGVRKGTGTPDWSATVFNTADTNPIFVVGSYTFNADSTTDDVAKMWLNPDPSTFGGATPADQLVHTGVADINAPGVASLIFFRRGNATLQPASMLSDEVRIGTTWADVTPPVPEPSSLVLTLVAVGMLSGARRRAVR